MGLTPKLLAVIITGSISPVSNLSSPKSPQNFYLSADSFPKRRSDCSAGPHFPQTQFFLLSAAVRLPKAIKLSKTLKTLNYLVKSLYKKLHQYYQMADVFIFPQSLCRRLGRTAMEAVACGLPVLGQIRELSRKILTSVSIPF